MTFTNPRFPTSNDKYLYHFTTAESLMKILESMSLRLSEFKNLNDLNETNPCCNWNDHGLSKIKIHKYIEEQCKLLCFSQNYWENNRIYSGINHPRMWAQYAGNNTGACIIIDEPLFIERNKKILRGKSYIIDNVEYTTRAYNKHITISSDTEESIKQYYKQILFKKHIDWEREHERRLVILDSSNINFLSIQNCVSAICLGNRFNKNKEYNEEFLHKILNNPQNKCYHQIHSQHFYRQCNIDGKIGCIFYFIDIDKTQ